MCCYRSRHGAKLNCSPHLSLKQLMLSIGKRKWARL